MNVPLAAVVRFVRILFAFSSGTQVRLLPYTGLRCKPAWRRIGVTGIRTVQPDSRCSESLAAGDTWGKWARLRIACTGRKRHCGRIRYAGRMHNRRKAPRAGAPLRGVIVSSYSRDKLSTRDTLERLHASHSISTHARADSAAQGLKRRYKRIQETHHGTQRFSRFAALASQH
jgi:hypothetical protein